RFVRFDRLGNDVAHPHARTERAVRVLEDDLDLAPVVLQVRAAQLREVATIELDGTGRGFFGRQHELRRGRLAAPGLSDEPERLAWLDREADPVDGLDHAPCLAEERAAHGEVLPEIAHVEQRPSHARRPPRRWATSTSRCRRRSGCAATVPRCGSDPSPAGSGDGSCTRPGGPRDPAAGPGYRRAAP